MAKLVVFQGAQRSGTSWLLSLLQGQPGLAVRWGELLHPSTFDFGYVTFYLRAMDSLLRDAEPGWLERSDPTFNYFAAREQIARDYLRSLSEGTEDERLLIHVKLEQMDYFPEFPQALYSADVDFLILKRMNVLAQVVSGAVMRSSGVSHYTAGAAPHPVRLSLDPRSVLSQMREVSERQARYARRAESSGGRCINVVYEDLVAEGPEAVLVPAFEALGITVSGLASDRVKSPTPPLSELLENYDEIRAAVLASEFDYTLSLPE